MVLHFVIDAVCIYLALLFISKPLNQKIVELKQENDSLKREISILKGEYNNGI